MVMVARVATQARIPVWQPVVGLIGVLLWTWLTIWAGGRIFRIGILSQGKRRRLAELARRVAQG